MSTPVEQESPPEASAVEATSAVSSATPSGKGMTLSGFCAYPSPGSHPFCREKGYACACPCHTDPNFTDRSFIEEPVMEDAVEAGDEGASGGA